MMRRPRMRVMLAVALLSASVGLPSPSSAAPGVGQRLSVTSSEKQADGPSPAITVDDTTSPSMALAGGHVAFSSDATNLVSGDTNGAADVFMRVIDRGKTYRISVNSSEAQANGPSHSPAVSYDGRYVAFVSEATNLVSGDTNGVEDIFLRDTVAGTTKRLSLSSSGKQANGPSWSPSISLFGDWIGFDSDATNLDTDGNGMPDAYVHHATDRRTTRIDPPALAQAEPTPNDRSWTSTPTVSYDGTYIAFQRLAARLVPASTPIPREVQQVDPRLGRPGLLSRMDVYVMTRKTKAMRRIKIPQWGSQQLGSLRNFADHPKISAEGNHVVLDAWSVMDYERKVTDTLQCGPQPVDTTAICSTVDPAGKTVSHLDDDGLIRNPVDFKDAWVYDRPLNVSYLVSRSAVGFAGDADTIRPSVASQGAAAIAFESVATNLSIADTNAASDVFVYDNRDRATGRMSVPKPARQSAGPATRPSLSYDGRLVAYITSAADDAADSNNVQDIYMRDRQTHYRDGAPNLKLPKTEKGIEKAKVRTLNIGETFSYDLPATEPDGDPLRYGYLISAPPEGASVGPVVLPLIGPVVGRVAVPTVAPHGFSVDPLTGHVEWTPRIDQNGPWLVVFAVEDPRGHVDWGVMKFVVRSAVQSVDCRARPC